MFPEFWEILTTHLQFFFGCLLSFHKFFCCRMITSSPKDATLNIAAAAVTVLRLLLRAKFIIFLSIRTACHYKSHILHQNTLFKNQKY